VGKKPILAFLISIQVAKEERAKEGKETKPFVRGIESKRGKSEA